MNNLWTLMKVDLRETLDVRKFKENKSKSISFLSFLALILVLGLLISVLYNYIFTLMFYEGNANLVYSTLFMAGLASILTFSTSLFKVKSIFIGKDYEMLRSMPVKKTTIIAAKILNLYLIELVYAALIMLPNIIITLIFGQSLFMLPFGLLIMLLVPAVPMLVACLFSLFITLVADRYKFGNFINFILYAIMFVAIMFFSFSMNTSGATLEDGTLDISGYVSLATHIAWINPTLQLVRLTFINNYAYILIFVGTNIVFFLLVTGFIAFLFDKVHALIHSYKSNIVYIRKELETKGQFKALLFHEYKRFFTSKFYFINSISSGICAIVMSAFLAFMFSKYSMIENIEEVLPFFKEYGYFGTLFIAFGIGIATPASASISIEGGNFWMVKTFPIDYKKYVLAKLIVSISILGACSLVSSIIIIALMVPTVFSSIMLIITPLAFVVLASTLGLVLNLTYYKLKWKNEQECVKNSAGVVISMFLDWAVMLVFAGILLGFSFVHPFVAGILGFIVLCITAVILYIILMKTVNRKIQSIEEF